MTDNKNCTSKDLHTAHFWLEASAMVIERVPDTDTHSYCMRGTWSHTVRWCDGNSEETQQKVRPMRPCPLTTPHKTHVWQTLQMNYEIVDYTTRYNTKSVEATCLGIGV